MRKALIAVVVASALFAVGAFAANVTITAEDVASGNADVGSCADTAVVNFDTSAAINTTYNDFLVETATVTFQVAGVTTDQCDGAKADLAINSGIGSADDWFNATSVTVGTPSGTAAFTGLSLPVNPIKEVAVLVDGVPIPTP